MRKIQPKIFIGLFVIVSALCSSAVSKEGSEEKPFWKAKAKVYQKILKERAVIVSVKATELNPRPPEEAKYRLDMVGATAIESPRSTVFEILRDGKELKALSTVFKEVKYSTDKRRLDLHCEAFKYHAQMRLDVQWREEPKTRRSEMHFHVIAGTFQGLTGILRSEELSSTRNETSLTAKFFYNKLPVPDFFVEFGLEVVLQKMAARLRTRAEEKKSLATAKVQEGRDGEKQ